MDRNFYEVLGVSKDATGDDIRKAYRDIAKRSHPDMNRGKDNTESTERFKEAGRAYEVLSDPDKRRRYDAGQRPDMHFRRSRRPASSPFGFQQGGQFESVVEEFFGESVHRGRNIQARIEIELKDVITGTQKKIKIKRRGKCDRCKGHGYTEFTPCASCSGTGRVNINETPFQIESHCQVCGGTGKSDVLRCEPCHGQGFTVMKDHNITVNVPAGIFEGMQIRMPGQGEVAKKGEKNGDLIIFVLVKKHEIFIREQGNLILNVPVSYTQVALGDTITLPTLSGEDVSVKIPAGTQSGTRFRIKGQGLPDARVQGHIGDMIAFIKVETPKKMDEDYIKIVKELAEMEKKDVTPKRKAWSKKVDPAS
jgi:molecular chaperone DnaJ